MKFVIRSESSGHRQSTWLELFFDLAFVISIATLSHQVVEHPSLQSVGRLILLFIPVWWVWNQFTWYSSHFDNDDLRYRVFMLAGVGGTLAMAGGLHHLETGHTTQFVLSYLFLHLTLLLGWYRAYRHVPQFRPYIRLKSLGILLGIGLWSFSLTLTGFSQFAAWGGGVVLQLIMPVFAWISVRDMISIHHQHLTERHGLFTIIVLGESLVALTHATGHVFSLSVGLQALSLFLIVISLWWIYFDWKYDPIDLKTISQAFGFNYGHFFLYGSLAVIAAGIGIFPQGKLFGARIILLGIVAFLSSMSVMNLIKPHLVFPKRIKIRAAFCGLLLILVVSLFWMSPTTVLPLSAISLLVLAMLEYRNSLVV